MPATAHAAAWTGLQDVSDLTHTTQQPPVKVQIGVDNAGNAFEVQLADKGPPQFVEIATRPAGGDWRATQDIGQVATNTAGPALAVDSAGHALVVFLNTSATAPCVATVTDGCMHIVAINPDGTYSETLFNNGGLAGSRMFDPAVAFDPSGNGNAVIAWRATPSANNAMQAINGSFGGPWPTTGTTLPGATTSTIALPHVSIDGSGRALATWTESVTGIFSVRSSLERGTVWAAPQTRATNAAGGYSGLFEQTNAQGNIDLAWVGPSGANDIAQTITWDNATGGFPAAGPDTLASVLSTHTLVGPRVMTASDGEAVAVWMDDFTSTTSTRSVMAAVRSGGTWGAGVPLDPNSVDPAGPALAMDGAGNATAVWHNSTIGALRYAVHAHNGAFGGTFDGPASPQAPVTAADSAGHVHAAWSKSNTGTGTAVFDPVAPGEVLAAPSVAAPIPGTVVGFASSTSDLWSNPVSVHWDFGDGGSADGTTASHAYGSPGTYTAKAIATDASGNSTTQSETVTVSAAPVKGLPKPVAGQTVNLEPVGGTVLVKVPGGSGFVPLVSPTQVRNGSIIDARKGRVRITIDNGRGGLDTADFYGGIFEFEQPKVKPGQTWYADLFLFGGSFKGCPKAPKNPKLASVSTKKSKKQSASRSVRHLWGSGEGAFRTVGRFSSATVRGTTWLTDDHCNGTLTKVTAGKVGVRDFVLRKTIVVKKGKSYFASPKPKKR